MFTYLEFDEFSFILVRTSQCRILDWKMSAKLISGYRKLTSRVRCHAVLILASTDDPHVDKITTLVRANRRLTIRELSEECGISVRVLLWDCEESENLISICSEVNYSIMWRFLMICLSRRCVRYIYFPSWFTRFHLLKLGFNHLAKSSNYKQHASKENCFPPGVRYRRDFNNPIYHVIY